MLSLSEEQTENGMQVTGGRLGHLWRSVYVTGNSRYDMLKIGTCTSRQLMLLEGEEGAG